MKSECSKLTIVSFRSLLQMVGYELEFTAAHNFLGPEVRDYIVGGGFRGCVTNFTLNRELQSPLGEAAEEGQTKRQRLLEYVGGQSGSNPILQGCDVEVLSVSADARTSVDIGVTVVIVFFVLLLCALAGSFTYYRYLHNHFLHYLLLQPRIIFTRFRTKLAVLLRRIMNQNNKAEIKS